MKTPPDQHELVTGPGSRPRLRPLMSHMLEKGLLAGTLVAGQILFAPLAHAGPEGGTVISGQGSITRINALDTQISQQSQNLLMNFDSFDLSKDETVLINQPDAAAWFVGRVVGGSPTAIFGSITANGRIALVNPQGVIFGETASINAAGVFASALGLANQDLFQKEGAIFKSADGPGGYVINHGVINASVGGSVTLLGESVTNSGIIVATLGQVTLATGSQAVVSFGPDQLIGIEVTEEVLENNESLRSALTNTGTIDAAGGTVMLTSSVSKSLFDHAINNEGVIRAKDAEYKDGVITLFGSGSSVLNTGTIDASSAGLGVAGGQVTIQSDSALLLAGSGSIQASSATAIGGQVQINANSVSLTDTSSIDVSGATGGGRVEVNALTSALVAPDASIRADAWQNGDGGQIAITAESINIAGEFSARGGNEAGDGGQVTLEATNSLAVSGTLDVGAANGSEGTINLIAPVVEVSDSGAENTVNLANTTGDIEISATEQVAINNIENDLLDLGNSDLTISVDGNAASALESRAVAFLMTDASDTVITTGQITISVTDGSVNVNALIDIAGTIESKPFPEPLPNDPLAPADTISLAANNGRIRIRNTGQLIANGLDAHEGSVRLIATGYADGNESGTVYFEGQIDVSNSTGMGGSAKVLGDRVALQGDATINASGDTGGGEVLVGGNYQGKGEEHNALRTFVGEDVSINADALAAGDGGTVIVWADESTRFFGSIVAKGGPEAGSGGFAEVSGKETLRFAGSADLRGVDSLGTLLLDPTSIVITGGSGDGASDGTATFSGDPSGVAGTVLSADTAPTTIFESELEALGSTVDVALQATESISTSGTFTSGIVLSGGGLTLETVNDVGGAGIVIGESLTATFVSITTGSDATPAAAPVSIQSISSTLGAITINASGDVTLGGAVASMTNIGIDSGGSIVQDGAITSATTVDLDAATTIGLNAAISGVSGTVDIDGTGTTTIAAAGDISAGGAVTFGANKAGGISTSGDVTTTNDDIGFNSATVLTGNVLLNSGSGAGTVTFANTVEGTVANTQTLGITAGTGNVDFDNTVGTGTALGALTLTSAGNVTADNTIDAASLSQVAGSGTTQFDGDVTATTGNVGVVANAITLNALLDTATAAAGGTVTLNAATGALTLASAGDINSDGLVSLTSGTSISTSGDVTTTNDDVTFTSAVTLGGAVSIDTGGGVAGNILISSTVAAAGNNLTLDAGPTGNITLSGALSGGGNLTVVDGAVQSYDALTVNLISIQDATTSVTLGGGVASTTTIAIDSGGAIVQDGAITSATNVDLDAGSTLGLNALISGVSGTVDIDATGVTTIAAAANITVGDAVIFGADKTGTVATSADVTATNADVTFTNAVTLAADVTVISGTGTTSFTSLTDGAGTFTLSLGNAGQTGAVTISDNVTIGGLNTFGSNFDVSLLGASNTFDGTSTLGNTGTLTLGNEASDVIAFINGLDATAAGAVSVAGSIQSSGTSGITLGDADTAVSIAANTNIGGVGTGVIDLGDVTLADNATLTIGSGIANIVNLDSVSGISGNGQSNLTINTTGVVSVAEAIGTDIGVLTLTQSGGTTFVDSVDAATVALTDTTGTIAFQGNLSVESFSTAAAGYNVSLTGGSNTITNAVTFSNSGTLALGDATTDATTFTGGVTATAPSGVTVQGTVVSGGTNGITVGDADTGVVVSADTTIGGAGTGTLDLGDVTLADGATLIVGTGLANAINLDAVTGTVGGTSSNVTLNTTGVVNVAEAVGTDIGVLTLTQSSGTTFVAAVDTTTVTLTDTTGTIAFGGDVTASTLNTTANGYGLQFLEDVSITNDVVLAAVGNVTIGNGNDDVALFASGLDTTASTGNTSISGFLRTQGTQIDLGNIALTADTAIDTTNNTPTVAGANINIGSVSGTGAILSIDAGAGGNTATFSGAVQLLALNTFARNYNIAFQAAGNTVTNFANFLNAGSLVLGNTDVNFAGGANVGDVSVTGSATLSTSGSNLIIDDLSSPSSQMLTINTGATTVGGAVDGVNITVQNSGGVTFNGVVGQTNAVGLQIDNTTAGQNVSFLANTTLSSLITTGQGYGVSFTGPQTTIQASVDLLNSGGITLGNEANDRITLTNGLTNSGLSTISLLGQLFSQGAAISLGNVDLGSGVSVVDSTNSGAVATGSNISFGIVDGTNSTLAVDAGTGGNTVTFSGSTELQALTTFAKNYNLAFLGSDNTITNFVNFLNTGSLSFGNAASDSIEFTGGAQVASATFLNGTASTTGTSLSLQQLTIADGGTGVIETSGGDISVTGQIAGEVGTTDSADNLVLNAGAGDVSLQAGVQLNNLTVTSNQVTITQGVNLTGSLNVTNAGLLDVQGGQNIVAAGGLTTSGNVRLSSDVQTSNSNVNINGTLTLAENIDSSIVTQGGDLTIVGDVQGAAGAGNETLSLNTTTGEISLGNLFGATGADDATGLTDLTIVNSGVITFDEIDISGDLTQTNAATGNTLFGDKVSLSTANLKGTNFTFGDFTSASAVDIAASGLVGQSMGTRLTAGGVLTVAANSLSFDDLAAGAVVLNVNNDAVVSNTGSVSISGSTGRNLTLTNQGAVNVGGSIGRDLVITATSEAITSTGLAVVGDSTFTGLELTATNFANTGDITFAIDDDVVLQTTGAVVIDGSSSNLDVSSAAGSVTDGGNLQIDGLAKFTANGASGAITINNTGNMFGSVSLESIGAIILNESDGTQLDRVVTTDFKLTSAGNVTDGTGAQLSITGLAEFDVTGDISLGDEAADSISFNRLEISATDVVIGDDSADGVTIGDSTLKSLVLLAGGDIFTAENANLSVSSVTELNANAGGSNIDVSNSSNTFGNLSLTGSDVKASSTANLILSKLDADSATITSNQAISDFGNASIRTTGEAVFSARQTIDLGVVGGNTVQFGSVNVSGTTVSINELDSTLLTGSNAANLTYISGGEIVASGVLNVTDVLSLNAQQGTADVSLLNTNNNFTNLIVNGAAVTANNSAATVLAEIGAQSFALVSGGDVTDGSTGAISVTGFASITANNDGNISLGVVQNSGVNDRVTLGSVQLTGNRVSLVQTNDINVVGLTVADDLSLVSIEGDITATISAAVQLVDDGTTTVDLRVNENEGVINFGSDFAMGDLSAIGLSVTVVEVGDLTIDQLVATSATLSATNITDENGATIAVSELATFISGGSVILDSGNVNFGTLDVTALGSQFSIGELLGEIRVGQQANIRAERVTFGLDTINEFGGLAVTTSAGGAVDIFSDISFRIAQGSPTNVEGNFTFSSNNITLGAAGRSVTIKTVGSDLGGGVVFTGIDEDTNPIASTGTLSLAGTTAIDTTNGGITPGANVNLMSDAVGNGTIISTGEGETSLSMAAGSGTIAVGNLMQGSEINTFTVLSGGDITLNDLFVAGNTVSLNVSGDVVANGVIQDTVGDVSIATTGGSITLGQDVTSSGVLSLTADAGSLTTTNVTAGGGLNVAAGGDVQLGGDVAVNSGDTSVVSATGSITTGDSITQTGGSFSSAGNGSVSFRSSGAVLLGGSTTSGGTLTLTSTADSVTASGPITSAANFSLSAGTGISVNQIDVTAGALNVAVGSGNLLFNNSVNVSGDFSALSLGGGFEQGKNTLISSGADIVISTQAGMKIASLSGGTNVTLAIRETDVVTGTDAPIFERVNDAITFGDATAIPDVQSGTGAISYLSQVASVGTADANQNFVQRSGTGIFYGLVSGQFFSDDIGASQVLATAPTSVDSALNLFTDSSSGIGGLLAGDVFGSNFTAISSQIALGLAGTGNASSNAGQTSASSSSRSTAASQRDDEDEVAEVDEAAFQNLKNYDQNPQGILLPEDQQFAYDDEGNSYFLVSVRSQSGQFESFPLFKVDLTLQPALPVTVATFTDSWSTSNEADD